ncbi:DNA recombinase [Duganella sp. FT109W]|uniref:DNA recombinase n=1 Tax=Duganella margarita TaxID=2692170 RepID=A0ABW9WPC7_9BURK|nr:RecT family recombinase [Duganella margarita]MYN42690.1 DNA recombinase [Duganella margarita]
MSNALAIVTGAIQEAREDFSRVLGDRSLSFERESGFAIQQLQKNDYTLGVAMKNKASVINAVTNMAAIGISLNPARKQAYLVPRDGQICLDISYIGLLDLAVASGSILWGQAELVREHDLFKRVGMDKQPVHEFEPFGKNRGLIIGAYVVAKLHNGDFLTTMMDMDEVCSIRDRSEGWKAFCAKKIKSTPWASDEGEMIKKTVIKRAYKLWPKTERLDAAMTHLNTTGEGLAPDRPDNWVDVAPMIAEVLRTTTAADAKAYWQENNSALAGQPADHKRLKDAMIAHGMKLADLAKRAAEAHTVEMEPTGVAMTDDEALAADLARSAQ